VIENMNRTPAVDLMPSALQQAGVNCLEFESESVGMKEVTGVSLVRLHSLQDPPQLDSGELELPQKPGQCSDSDPAALCLRPREWLVVSQTIDPAELLQLVRHGISHEGTSANDNSEGLALFRLSGHGAPWLLSKLSGLDYLAGTAEGTHCTRTKMGQAAVVIHYHQAEGKEFVFDLIFDRSIAKYLWDLLSESCQHADDLSHDFGNPARSF
jgi:heterotetrameric sarcosine oxidase gamma subunit